MGPLIERLENMLASGNDNLLLRYSLGKAYAEQEAYDQARVIVKSGVWASSSFPV